MKPKKGDDVFVAVRFFCSLAVVARAWESPDGFFFFNPPFWLDKHPWTSVRMDAFKVHDSCNSPVIFSQYCSLVPNGCTVHLGESTSASCEDLPIFSGSAALLYGLLSREFWEVEYFFAKYLFWDFWTNSSPLGESSPSWAPRDSISAGWRSPCMTPAVCVWIQKPMRRTGESDESVEKANFGWLHDKKQTTCLIKFGPENSGRMVVVRRC